MNWEMEQFHLNPCNRPKGEEFRVNKNLSTSAFHAN